MLAAAADPDPLDEGWVLIDSCSELPRRGHAPKQRRCRGPGWCAPRCRAAGRGPAVQSHAIPSTEALKPFEDVLGRTLSLFTQIAPARGEVGEAYFKRKALPPPLAVSANAALSNCGMPTRSAVETAAVDLAAPQTHVEIGGSDGEAHGCDGSPTRGLNASYSTSDTAIEDGLVKPVFDIVDLVEGGVEEFSKDVNVVDDEETTITTAEGCQMIVAKASVDVSPAPPLPGCTLSREQSQEALVAVGQAAPTTSAAQWELVEAELDGSDYVHVPATKLTLARSFARQQPALASGALWAAFAILVMGELATTVWWLYDLGMHGCLLLCLPLGLFLSLALSALSPEQVLSASVSLAMAALPALPAYSAVLLVAPPSGGSHPAGSGASCWEGVHWPSLLSLAVMYLVSAILPALRAEFRSPERRIARVISALEKTQQVARGLCILAAYLYTAVALHLGMSHLLASGGEGGSSFKWWGSALVSPFVGSRGAVLLLYAIGLACAEARAELAAALGPELLPLLLGARRAQALTLRALALQHSRLILRRVPDLRRFAPPRAVVAAVVAVRRTGPVLCPIAAVAIQFAQSELPLRWCLSAVLIVSVLAAISYVAVFEWKALPTAPLRQMPFLLPQGFAPLSRRIIGHALTAAENVEKIRGRFSGGQHRAQHPRCG